PSVVTSGAIMLKTKPLSPSRADVVCDVLDELGAAARTARARRRERPFVTLSWAQSVDGSLALSAGQALALSGADLLALTDAARAAHDAILVGIGTLLADDPQLSVRHWRGRSPAPIVLDSRLRTPAAARLF